MEPAPDTEAIGIVLDVFYARNGSFGCGLGGEGDRCAGWGVGGRGVFLPAAGEGDKEEAEGYQTVCYVVDFTHHFAFYGSVWRHTFPFYIGDRVGGQARPAYWLMYFYIVVARN